MSAVQNQSSMHEHFLHSRNNSKFILRLIARTIFITLISSILGISFILIAQGIILASFYLAFFWYPAFDFIAKLVNLDAANIEFQALKTTRLHLPLWLVQIVIFISPMIVGIWLLFAGGFLNQNLFFLIFH